MWRRLKTVLLALLTCVGAARAETVDLASAPVPPTPFRERLAAAQGTVAAPLPGARLTAELYRPAGGGPFPAVVALHDCGGREPERERAIVAPLVALGLVVLAVDSFTTRGIRQACQPGGGPAADRGLDALGALLWLAGTGFVDPQRVAVVGWGQGGEAALAAVAADGPGAALARRFAAAVAWYPLCRTAPPLAVLAPTLVLQGTRDNWARLRYCRAMVEGRDGESAPLDLVLYEGARHGFDVPRERAERFYGQRLEYDRGAAEAAAATMADFLRRSLALR
jgi:dienelactone hydrolase